MLALAASVIGTDIRDLAQIERRFAFGGCVVGEPRSKMAAGARTA